MKTLFILLFTFSSLFSKSSVEDIRIGKFDFTLIKKSYNIYDSKGEILQIYSENHNKNLMFELRLTLQDVTGDCSSKSLENGTYTIDNDGITLYSFWDRGGKAYLEPYGARIQRYELQSNAHLKQVSSVIYLETERKKYALNDGMQYLFKKAISKKEKRELKAYILEVERKYNAKFVYGNEAILLIDAVKKALKEKIKRVWKNN